MRKGLAYYKMKLIRCETSYFFGIYKKQKNVARVEIGTKSNPKDGRNKSSLVQNIVTEFTEDDLKRPRYVSNKIQLIKKEFNNPKLLSSDYRRNDVLTPWKIEEANCL